VGTVQGVYRQPLCLTNCRRPPPPLNGCAATRASIVAFSGYRFFDLFSQQYCEISRDLTYVTAIYLLQITMQQRRLRTQSNAGNQRAPPHTSPAHPSVRVPAPDRGPCESPPCGGGAAWWQRDERGLEETCPPASARLPLPPPPTHTWVAIHESRSYVR